MKDKKTRLVEKSARVDESRGQKHRRDLKLAAKQDPVQNRCSKHTSPKMRRFRHGLPPKGTQKPRRKNDEKSGTPNGSTGAARFSNGTDQHWKSKKQQQRHRITHS
ncbi:hypothetical protein Zmor_001374 [Zophobas morio]|uniref:Uncharacterized protein n=1 Tax=Zophobas morio TaxID=2755281 RepID=A0AA38IZ09_9CUCU|nr:hypothetical protein Zmor_001374 [Zophobas morio]